MDPGALSACWLAALLFMAMVADTTGQGNHAFEVLRTAEQRYRWVDFFAIEARLPADGLSASENWCQDYQNLCADYGLRPTGCGEFRAVSNGLDYQPNIARCVSDYNSNPYLNDVLGCIPSDGVAEVANLAFSSGATERNSFGFTNCHPANCQRGIDQSQGSLSNTRPNEDGIVYTVCTGGIAGNHAFEVIRTANQQYQGIDFFAIEARLPADGLSASESWCQDYQNLCADFGLRPTGCGEFRADPNGGDYNPYIGRCVSEYNSDPNINNVLGCIPSDGVAEVANLAFSSGATERNSFGFTNCHPNNCQRGIDQSQGSLSNTRPNEDRIVYTVCKEKHAFEVLSTVNQQYQGIDFFAIEARLPADGLSASESWCRDYQILCADYGLRPTGCGASWVSNNFRTRCELVYNSDRNINDVLGCPPADRVAEVANLAFLAGTASQRSFGFNVCHPNNCQRGIDQSQGSLSNTRANEDRIVYTVCSGTVADKDECADDTHNCHPQATCTNRDGGFTCACNPGYDGNGVSCTAIQCPALIPPANGELDSNGNSYPDAVGITCDPGYKAAVDTVTCQADGTWSDVPTCNPIPSRCDPNPCQYGGKCTDVFPTGYSCPCRNGYKGNDCEIGCKINHPGFPKDKFTIYDSRCHWFSRHKDRANYAGAERFCQNRGGRLVTIKTAAKQKWITGYIKKIKRAYYIGLDDRSTEGSWEWSDGTFWTPGDYNNWRRNRAPTADNLRDCVLMNRGRQRWNAVNCSKRVRFICEMVNTI